MRIDNKGYNGCGADIQRFVHEIEAERIGAVWIGRCRRTAECESFCSCPWNGSRCILIALTTDGMIQIVGCSTQARNRKDTTGYSIMCVGS